MMSNIIFPNKRILCDESIMMAIHCTGKKLHISDTFDGRGNVFCNKLKKKKSRHQRPLKRPRGFSGMVSGVSAVNIL